MAQSSGRLWKSVQYNCCVYNLRGASCRNHLLLCHDSEHAVEKQDGVRGKYDPNVTLNLQQL